MRKRQVAEYSRALVGCQAWRKRGVVEDRVKVEDMAMGASCWVESMEDMLEGFWSMVGFEGVTVTVETVKLGMEFWFERWDFGRVARHVVSRRRGGLGFLAWFGGSCDAGEMNGGVECAHQTPGRIVGMISPVEERLVRH